MKGRINVIRNERTNMAIKRFDRVFCEYDEYTVDIPENKLIKKALLFCKQILRTVIEHHKDGSKVKQMLLKSLLIFERVSEDVQVREVTQIKAHKLFNEYSEAVRLAKLILRRYDFSISKTSTEDDNILPSHWICHYYMNIMCMDCFMMLTATKFCIRLRAEPVIRIFYINRITLRQYLIPNTYLNMMNLIYWIIM